MRRRQMTDDDAGAGGPLDDGDAGSSAPSVRDRAFDALDRLVAASATERLLISGSALLLSIAIGFLLILAAGRMTSCGSAAYSLLGVGFCYDPFLVYDSLFLGAFGDFLANPLNGQFATTVSETTVLVFTGIAVAVAFKAGVFNIGGQGQLVFGALASALVVYGVSGAVSGLVGTLVLVSVGLATGAFVGGIWGAIPGALKAYADANEVITTIMLNFVATSFALYLASGPFKDPESFANQTRTLPEFALFPQPLFPGRTDASLLALALAITVAVGIAYLLRGTSFGYDVRTSGIQPEAAEYGGVDAARTVVASMALSGALAGLGGAVYVFTIAGNFQTGVPDYGFDGITVSILAGNNPVAAIAAALLFGVLKSGSIVVDVGTDVPPELVGVLRGLIVLFVAMPEFFRMIGERVDVRDRLGGSRDAVATDGGEEA
ncbi:nucleoside ABC transporter membrane protein [Halobaculum gomorrense]|uniref:Nucleoside ABC transporter membrane protein n=2 Tax=Halobaculum gomorrense TaxID=43928 RepID=A0A1M5N5N5_9EURY|nr:nucleoside ABC transporter membrane protein [Halobaculum gomorrense]